MIFTSSIDCIRNAHHEFGTYSQNSVDYIVVYMLHAYTDIDIWVKINKSTAGKSGHWDPTRGPHNIIHVNQYNTYFHE